MRKYNFLLLISLIMFCSCFGQSAKNVEIVVLSTNDAHGQIDNYAKLSAYVKKVRAENKHVFLFSAGDIFSGNPLVDQYPDRGYPMVDLMNKLNYNLATFGNHEFDYGQEALAARLKQAQFPFILANAHVAPNGIIPQFKPYTTFDIEGNKMTVLSVIEVGGGGTPSTHPDRVQGVTFEKPIEKALEYKNLKEKSNLFIGLTHIGANVDVELAKVMPELDIIIGGHSHTRIDTAMLVNGVLITQADSYLRYLGETRIVMENGKVKSKTNRLINLSKLTEVDEEVQKIIDEYKKNDPGQEVIGKTTENIEGKQALGALMTDAITTNLGLDIAVQNAGGVRVNKILAGDISINNVFALDPFGNDVVKLSMTGEEIYGLIESTFRRAKIYTNPDLLVSGITYTATINSQTNEFIKLEINDSKGNALDMKKVYKVGMNSYIYTKYQFTHADPGESLHVTASTVLIEFIKQKQTLSEYAKVNRIQIIDLAK